MKDIELPRRVVVGENALKKIPEVIHDLGIEGNFLVIADETTYKIAGKRVADILEAEEYIIEAEKSMRESIEDASKFVKKKNVKFAFGVGGGRVIDITKVCSFTSNINYASVPTSASHDGITSPQASIKDERPVSIRVHCPLAIIADLSIIRKAPKRLLASGCADVISNYTAVLDWKLAAKEKGEYFGDYAASLAMMSAQIVMENASVIWKNIKILVEALISSGVAMGIAGSSRPCSGAEHMFSHMLDILAKGKALHGEQCGVGAIIMAYLHNPEGEDWKRIKEALKKVGAPTTAKELGIDEETVIKALVNAHKIRDRYTILRNGISAELARKACKATGVFD
ncbi:MAG: NAD(P)-dependent glycerol-1-phosphate dehydrogenase [Candidatus Altiarchaeales archaeon]|nr:MAG: NAD(P)-dependent glycerol-1-phosphate dehydrogenase [Candidatus Altiarchaeales archaeon]